MTRTLVVSATFTAEPIQGPLEFWANELSLPLAVEFAPFNQVFQSLLDPGSAFATNTDGMNVVLFRWQDFGSTEQIATASQELADSIETSTQSHHARLMVVSCAGSPDFLASEENATLVQQLDERLTDQLRPLGAVDFVSTEQLNRWYPVEDYYNAAGDRIGHIPFTPAYFAGLATLLARRMEALRRAPYKVIVLDCDNTLWRGVVGEDGPMGVVVSPAFTALQQFIVAQHDAGMLITVVSKNNEDDVDEIFRLRPDMPLTSSHVVTRRVNWDSKSGNIRSLATELDLGLDSFIFIDDNAKECAEVQEQCPDVLTLMLPENEDDIPGFLDHVWAFDHWQTTAEDRNRTAVYTQKLERGKVERTAPNLAAFIASLNLDIRIEPVRPEHLARTSQLTQRTNQFNITTIRRTELEIQELLRNGYECITVDVSDRFGAYGLVGALLYRFSDEALVVDSFMLSCRTLGRGVEHHILRHLGEQAVSRGLAFVDMPFTPTAKNAPARTFLESIGAPYRSADGESSVFHVPAAVASQVSYQPDAAVTLIPESDGKKKAAAATPHITTPYVRIATDLRDPETIARLSPHISAPAVTRTLAEGDLPKTGLERELAEMWAEMLGLPEVGAHDNFFEMGGTSLLAAQLLGQLIDRYANENLTLSSLLEAPTVEQFGLLLEQGGAQEYQSLVPMRAGGSRPPFYCVHGGGGNVLSLRNLAMSMPPDQPFYCLQAAGLDGKSEPFGSVEETAAHYVKAVREFQPDGPYFFGGASFGGLVAFEMARELERQNQKVGFVGLIDTHNHAYGSMLPLPKLVYYNLRFMAQRMLFHAARLGKLESDARREYLSGRFNSLSRHFRGFTSLITGSTKTQVVGHLPPGVAEVETMPGDFHRTLVRVVAANMRATRNFVPQFFKGSVTLFKAEEPFIEPYQDEKLGWGPVVGGDIEVCVVPGDHADITELPNVRTLAQLLDASLRKAQAV
ncbi:MAG: hypothetical protein JWM95_3957 [Gemmatimonadetes bacterium]|nr:hypothetical protein [Gemmatimonadota bacterium]